MSSRRAKKVRRMRCLLKRRSSLRRCVPVARSHMRRIFSKSSFVWLAVGPFLGCGRRKEALATPRFQLGFQIFPQLRTSTLNLRTYPFDHPLISHSIFPPAYTFAVEVQEDGHAAIDSHGKTSLIGGSRIKLFP